MADLDPAVTAAIERTKLGRQEHDRRLRKFDRAYEVYSANRGAAQRHGAEPWQSDLRVKYGKQVIDTALVNIVNGQPRCKVHPRQPDSELGAKAMQIVMDYYVAEDHMVEKQPVFTQQGLIYGITVAKNHWLHKTVKRPVKQFARHPLDPTQQLRLTGVNEQEVVVRDGPTFEPWSPYDCYWSPGAKDVDSASYVVLQTYISKEDLLALQFNQDTGMGIYHNVQQLIESGYAADQKGSAQDRALGNTRYKDKYLIEEIWSDDTLVVIGNRQVLLRAQQNPFWHGRKPIVIAQTNPDLYEMVGASETDLVDHLQQALWTVQNMRMDNLHLTVMRGITYREGGVTDPSQLELRPRFKWPVSDHDDIRPFEVQPLPPEAYNEETQLLSRLQLVTGVNSYVSGSEMAGVDQNTATGITALQEVASRLLRFKAGQLQYKGYQRAFEQWGDMIQQFMDRSIPVKLIGPGGEAQWVDVDPAMVAGHFNYVLEGTEESLSRQQERGEAIALLNAFAPLVPTGQVNIKPIVEKVAESYGFENPEELVAPAPPPQPPAAPMPQQQSTGGTNPQLLGGQTLDPTIANAIMSGRGK